MRAAAGQPGRRRPGDRHDGGHGRRASRRAPGVSAGRPSRRHRHRRRRRLAAITSRSAGKPTGPFTVEQLREQAAKGGLTRAALVWAPGMAGWQPAGEVAELAAAVRRGAAADPGRRLSPCRPGPGAGCGPRRTSGRRAGVKVSSPQLRQFTCEQCGAVLSYAPGTTELVCTYCGHRNRIAESAGRDRRAAAGPGPARGGRRGAAEPREIPAKCASCGADFAFKPPALRRPLPVLRPARGGRSRARGARSAPIGVLPFLIGAQEARRLVGDWLKGLWFAPSGIAEQARGPGRLHGVYLPYWTFDSRTRTRYLGPARRRLLRDPVCRRRGRRPPGAPGGAGAEDPLAPGLRARWRATSTTCWCWPARPCRAHLVEALEPWDLDGHAPVHRRLSRAASTASSTSSRSTRASRAARRSCAR